MSQAQQGQKSFAFQLEVELFAQVKWDVDRAMIFSKSPACPRAGCDCTWDIDNDDPKLNSQSVRCGLAYVLDQAGVPATTPDTNLDSATWNPLAMWVVDHDGDHPTGQYEQMQQQGFCKCSAPSRTKLHICVAFQRQIKSLYLTHKSTFADPIRLISRVINISQPTPFSAEIEKAFNAIKSVCLVESGPDLDCSTRVRVFRSNPTASTIDPWGSFDLLNMGMACLMYGQAIFDMIPLNQRARPSPTSITTRPTDNDTYERMRNFMLGTRDGGRASWATVYKYLNNNIHHMNKTPSQAAEWLVNFISSFDSTRAWNFRPLIAGDVASLGAFEFRLSAGTVDPKRACHWVSFAISFIISANFEDYMNYSAHAWDILDVRLDKINGNHHMSLADLQDHIRQAWKVCNICSSDGRLVSGRLQSMLLNPLLVYWYFDYFRQPPFRPRD